MIFSGIFPISALWSIFFKNTFQKKFSRTDFIITASCDGHVKFWKKKEGEIEFVKHFRAHLGKVFF